MSTERNQNSDENNTVVATARTEIYDGWCWLYYLQDHFDGEDTGEDVVEVVEDEVAERTFKNWIFSGQRHATSADDDHDEQVKVAQIHDEVTEPTYAVHTITRRQSVPAYRTKLLILLLIQQITNESKSKVK